MWTRLQVQAGLFLLVNLTAFGLSFQGQVNNNYSSRQSQSQSQPQPRAGRAYYFGHNHRGRLPQEDNNKLFSSSSSQQPLDLYEPSESEATFGRQSYWDDTYRRRRERGTSNSNDNDNNDNGFSGEGNGDDNNKAFAWYSTWDDIEPFWEELVPMKVSTSDDDTDLTKILVAGVGNDPCVVSMYDAGWTHIQAYDYAPEGVALARELLGPHRLLATTTTPEEGNQGTNGTGTAVVQVADARNLRPHYGDGQFDAIFEKGTLDAIYLSGGTGMGSDNSDSDNASSAKERKLVQLQLSIDEMHRVLKPGGIVLSITSVAIDPIYTLFEASNDWTLVRDSRDVYVTDSGFASNNVDATMFAWKKKETKVWVKIY
jgi:SAM-dependent methyltransferase